MPPMKPTMDEDRRTVINHAAWNLLVAHAGAQESMRDDFLFHFPQCKEFRFQGSLGFGGKIWWNAGKLYISAYKEDTTQDIEQIVNGVNSRLLMLRCPSCKQYYEHEKGCKDG